MKGIVRLLVLAVFGLTMGLNAFAQSNVLPTGPWSKALDTPLKWYLRGSTADTADIGMINEKLNQALETRGFKAGVQIEFINRPDYATKLNLINASGEAYDLALGTEAWFNTYPAAVQNQYLINLTAYKNPQTGKTENLLKTYAPKLWASIPEATWNAAKIKDGIYSVINKQIYVFTLGVSFREDVMNVLGLKKELDAVKRYEDLTPIMDKVYKAIKSGALKGKVENSENLVSVFNTCDLVNPLNAGFDMFNSVYGVKYDDPSRKLVNWYASADFLRLVNLRKLWMDKGYCPADVTDLQAQINTYKAGQYVMDVGRAVKPGGFVEQGARMGFSWYEKAISPAYVRTAGPTATLTGISSTNEKDPNRVISAMKLLEVVNTDAEVYNIIAKGLEGVHWNWADKSKNLIKLVEGSKYNPNVDWAIGNQFNAYYLDAKQVGAWADTDKLNLTSKPSVALGFRFDMVPVKTELAALDATIKANADPLTNGLDPKIPDSIKKLLDNIEKSGGPKVLAELNKQFDAWKTGK